MSFILLNRLFSSCSLSRSRGNVLIKLDYLIVQSQKRVSNICSFFIHPGTSLDSELSEAERNRLTA